MSAPDIKRDTQIAKEGILAGHPPLTWVICGVSGAGKSSLAKRLANRMNFEFLDADDFHPQANRKKMEAGKALDEKDREPWLLNLEKRLRRKPLKPRVLAFPGLQAEHRLRILKAAAPSQLLFLRITKAAAERRVAERSNFFPASLVSSQFKALKIPRGYFSLDASKAPDELLAQAIRHIEHFDLKAKP